MSFHEQKARIKLTMLYKEMNELIKKPINLTKIKLHLIQKDVALDSQVIKLTDTFFLNTIRL